MRGGNFLKRFFKTVFASKVYTFSFIFLTVLLIVSIMSPIIPIDPNQTNVLKMSQPPSLQHLFGTDEIGRDYFIRVVHGGRVSLLVGLMAMATATTIGVIVGLISGYFGGIVDTFFMRLVDVLSSIPWMVLVIVLSVFLKPGLTTIIIVIGCFSWMNIARMIRGDVLTAKNREYVLYAEFIGQSKFNIMTKHIFPMVLPTLIVAATTSISNAIMTESALSFLGLGIQQPMSSWGSLLQNAQSSLQRAPYMAILPGLFVGLTIYSFNNIGDLIQGLLLNQEEV